MLNSIDRANNILADASKSTLQSIHRDFLSVTATISDMIKKAKHYSNLINFVQK